MLTVLGFLIGSALVAYGIITGKAPAEIFLNKQGLAIVLGGTIASTFVSYPLREVLRLPVVRLVQNAKKYVAKVRTRDPAVRLSRQALRTIRVAGRFPQGVSSV